MIPKIIHYCWLSNDPKPEVIRRCIASWEKHFPDYKLKLWNIDSMDYNAIPFTRDALKNRKWAFVADYVRLYALYHEGGIYLDSDVFALGKIDRFLDNRFFTGLEMRDKQHTQIFLEAAIMGAEAGHPFIREALNVYESRNFIREDGSFDETPIPTILSGIAEKKWNWIRKDEDQRLKDGMYVFSTESIANTNCKIRKTTKLYHLNSRSWIPQTPKEKFIRRLKRISRFLKF
ncbi:MAG: polysaccharide biosynthesis protein [Bacteroidales bacterium]|nr:polysaccharide biosynthesis protein [Bacteroidales bacterium]